MARPLHQSVQSRVDLHCCIRPNIIVVANDPLVAPDKPVGALRRNERAKFVGPIPIRFRSLEGQLPTMYWTIQAGSVCREMQGCRRLEGEVLFQYRTMVCRRDGSACT